jgi:hypothetical protein
VVRESIMVERVAGEAAHLFRGAQKKWGGRREGEGRREREGEEEGEKSRSKTHPSRLPQRPTSSDQVLAHPLTHTSQ